MLLGRYIFREVVPSSVLGTVLATFVIFLHGIDPVLEPLVGSSNTTIETAVRVLMLALPALLPYTIPFGVLVGILIGLGRLASDGEIIAMRAAGVSSRKVIAPVLAFALIGAALAGLMSLRWTPRSIRESTAIINQLMANQLSAEIRPRVFEVNFPNTILYIGDVERFPSQPGQPPVARWHPVFIADLTPPEQRSNGVGPGADGPLVTVSREAMAVSDPVNNRLLLSLRDYSTHEMGRDRVAHDIGAEHGQQALYAEPPRQRTLPSSAMNTGQLMQYRGTDAIEMRIELHRRFALPVACLMLALVGIPLGITTAKGGKSAGYVTAVLLTFFCYHLSSITLIGLAKQRTLPVPLAVWLPDAAFGIVGAIFLYRMERPGERDLLGALKDLFGRAFAAFKRRPAEDAELPRRARAAWRLRLLPQIVDTYILSNFLFYVTLWLAGFVSLTLVYSFFELMPDMVRNKIPMVKMFTYLLFLIPNLIYLSLPFSILVAVLVTLGVLSKQNEVTAFKACGVSLARLAMPILAGSLVFSGGLFAFDFYYVPGANVKQDALRNEIKGKEKQVYRQRNWIRGYESRIFNYKYFDPAERVMVGVNVFELDPNTFRMTRQILAERARWSPSLKTWVFESGWSSDFTGNGRKTDYFQTKTFQELTEAPDYFVQEVVQEKQMNFLQLDGYIRDLQQSGVDTVKLQVQFYRKFSAPLFALIMAMLAVPFGFLVGNRGAMTGIGVSIAIAIAYGGIGTLCEKIGDVNQLPPAMAAWTPDLVFSLAGLYLMLRMRS